MREMYPTRDIWLGSLFLTESKVSLVDVQVSKNGRENITFIFHGEGLTRIAEAYCKEQAVANINQLRDKLNVLRDLIFQARKKQEGRK